MKFEHNFKDISDILNGIILTKNWKWGLNTRCKYINLTIDTRSGECTLMDRDMKEVSLDELLYQYKTEIENGEVR